MKHELNFYTGNHFDFGISDQLNYFNIRLREDFQFKLLETIPSEGFFLCIENFNRPFTRTVNSQNSKLGVILTELMELNKSGYLEINSRTILAKRTYIVDMQRRFFELIKCLPKIDFFVTLFGSPRVQVVKEVFPQIPIYNLCLWPNFTILVPDKFEYDYAFFGTITPYRKNILDQLKKTNSVIVKHGISETERAILMEKSKFVLNIPQDTKWGSISPMRVISSHAAGRFTVNLGTSSNGLPGVIDIKNLSELAYTDTLENKKTVKIETYNKKISKEDDARALKIHFEMRQN